MDVRSIPLVPDSAPNAPVVNSSTDFARVLDGLNDVLEGAQRSEDAFAAGTGSLQDAVYERARADVTVAIATATVGRVTQAVQSLLNMQV